MLSKSVANNEMKKLTYNLLKVGKDPMQKKGIKQHDRRDCGAACLATILLRHGAKVPLVTVREMIKVDKNGSSIYAITQAAHELHLHAEALKGELEEFQDAVNKGEIRLPVIAHVIVEGTLAHYVVVEQLKGRKVVVFDPAKGKCTYTLQEFNVQWTGHLITFKKMDSFESVNLRKGTFRKFYHIVLEQKSLFALVLGFSFLLAGISIISSLVYQRVIDNFVLGQSSEASGNVIFFSEIMQQLNQLTANIERLFMVLIAICLLQFTIYLVRGFFIAKISKKSSEILMYNYFSHMLRLPVSFFHDRETGELLSRFQDIGEIQDIISSISISLILDSVMVVTGAFVLASLNLRLFLLVVLLVSIYAIVVLVYRKPIASVNRDVMENDAQVTSVLKESIDGIETIKSFSGEEKYYAKLRKTTSALITNLFKGSLIDVSQSALLTIAEGMGLVFVFWIGSLFVIHGVLTLGTLIAFQSLIYFFLSPVQGLIGLQPEIQRATIAAERLNDVFEIKRETEGHRGQENFNSFKSKELILENIGFSYGYRPPVLKNISIYIEAGQTIGIIGKSGCGKTTLLHLLASFYPASCGRIMIGGIDFQNISLKLLRKNIIYVPQNSTLFSGSLRDNLLFGSKKANKAKLQEVIEGCQIKDIINKLPFGLDTVISENGKSLSGGERQRIALGRALLSEPEMLLLDESTSHLDIDTEKRVMDFIEDWCKDITCIMVTHKLSVIKRCEKVIFMKDGSVIGTGTHEGLLQKNKAYGHFIRGEV